MIEPFYLLLIPAGSIVMNFPFAFSMSNTAWNF